MHRTRQDWKEVPLIELPDGKPQRPISMLSRTLPAQTIVAAHSHDWGQLLYAYTGILNITTPSGNFLVPPHRAVWVPPNVPHEVSSLSGAKISSIHIMTEETQGLINECYVLEVSNLLRELIIEALHQPSDYQWLSNTGRLFRTLRDQISNAKLVLLHLPLPSDSRLLKICFQLQENPGDKRSLEQWGNYAGASGRTLQRIFQKETGLSFHNWRQQLRLQIAIQSLLAGNDSITKISSDIGYESSSAFITMFQQHMGLTPKEYTKSLIKDE